MKKTHAGFTALELLIVIGIIGVIVAIALVGLTRARIKSRDDSRIANMRIVQIALEDFKTACRNYPYSLDVSADNCMFSNGTVFGDFLSQLPTNPQGQPFKYFAIANPTDPTQCIGYHLGLELEMDNYSALQNDADFDSGSLSSCDITGQSQGFYGGNDDTTRLYDIKR